MRVITPEAGAYFQRAVKNDKVKSLTAQSLFWLAQTHYERNQFEDAVDGFFNF